MKIKIIEYSKLLNECKYETADKEEGWIDPFVGLAIGMSDSAYEDGFGYTLLDQWYEIPDDVLIGSGGVLLPRENEMVKLQMGRKYGR